MRFNRSMRCISDFFGTRLIALWVASLLMPFTAVAQSFINYESGQVHPIDVSPDGNTLAVCNTADNRIQIFDISSGLPVRPLPLLIDHIQVGIDPVSVRFLSNTELWAVNVISDTISVMDLTTGLVRLTIDTLDEPADVIFAGSGPLKAFVTCSAVDTVQVFDATNPAGGPLASIPINGEDPRALAVNPGGTRVFAAIFESGNHSTILSGNLITPSPPIFPNAVDSANSPYAGSPNPPPNNGATFSPPINGALPTPPGVSMIVKKNVGTGQWMDDNAGDWSNIVDGVNSLDSGRIFGWDMLDNDVAVIDATSFAVTYATGMMNICMAITFNPATNSVSVVGTDATNEIRFEPNITGTFIRDNLATFVDGAPGTAIVNDMNVTHLDAAQGGAGLAYMDGDVPQAERDKSIGDPRGVVWMGTGKGYVTGMGSNNVLPLINASTRTSTGATIEVGEGPTGLALNLTETRLYVLNKFAGSVSTIDTATDAVLNTINFFDPSPPAIKVGRKHLYDTHTTSGLGHIACASCHVDGKMDRLAWDLGDPTGVLDPVALATHNMGMGILGFAPSPPALAAPVPDWEDSHPMKGPMTTQTFQDIIGKEPFHWRGDRQGLESFNPAFVGLNGDDTMLTVAEMQEFEDFVATFYFPPNPFRNLDNTLPTSVPLAGQFSTGRFSGSGGLNRGDPMPAGDPQRGLRLYMGTEAPNDNMDGAVNCVTCHSLPIGNGADSILRTDNSGYDAIPLGPLGNHHIGMVSTDTAKNIAIKTPHTRNVLDKSGYSNAVSPSRAGFGFFHDGSIDSVTTFLSSPVFDQRNDQDIADLVALMFAFSGSDFGSPAENPPVLFFNGAILVPLVSEPPSLQTSKDTHAAVGQQQTINTPVASLVLINQYIDLADADAVDLIVNGLSGGNRRSWLHTTGASAGTPMFQSDRAGETIDRTGLLALASVGTELTFTVVQFGTGSRLALDRDGDTAFNFDEVVAGSDPADPTSLPGGLPLGWPSTALSMLALVALAVWRVRQT